MRKVTLVVALITALLTLIGAIVGWDSKDHVVEATGIVINNFEYQKQQVKAYPPEIGNTDETIEHELSAFSPQSIEGLNGQSISPDLRFDAPPQSQIRGLTGMSID